MGGPKKGSRKEANVRGPRIHGKMASWALLGVGGEEAENEPNEDNVPFVMRLDNEGLRIISKMRRINTMVRTHRTWTAWVKFVAKANKERESKHRASHCMPALHCSTSFR